MLHLSSFFHHSKIYVNKENHSLAPIAFNFFLRNEGPFGFMSYVYCLKNQTRLFELTYVYQPPFLWFTCLYQVSLLEFTRVCQPHLVAFIKFAYLSSQEFTEAVHSSLLEFTKPACLSLPAFTKMAKLSLP